MIGRFSFACAFAAVLAAGCQAGTQDVAEGGSSATASGGGGSASTFTTGVTSATSATGFETGVGGGSCAKYQHTEVHKPVNLYIMFDKSSSMVGTKWDNAKVGLKAYVENPGPDTVNAALRFFPRKADSTPACDQTAYQTPTVDYGALPGNASAIETAIDAEAPNGFDTPMYPALGGALLEGIQQAANNPGEVSAVLLVTDGEPQGPGTSCASVDPNDPAVIANLAKVGLSKGVSTYVVGLPGVNQAVANQIAAAGGTQTAILVSVANVAVEFQKALQNISTSAVPCDYDIPEEVTSGEIGLMSVNVEVTPSSGPATTIGYDQTCAAAGWKYDSTTKPTKIILCPETCAAIKQENGASIEVVLGCGTIPA